MKDFHAPPLSEIIQVTGSGSRYSLSLKPTSGIPGQCMKDFLVAVDNHVTSLENDRLFHINEEFRANQRTNAWSQRLNNHKREQLASNGCACNSTLIRINGTCKSSYQKYMGLYHFEAMYQVIFSLLKNYQIIVVAFHKKKIDRSHTVCWEGLWTPRFLEWVRHNFSGRDGLLESSPLSSFVQFCSPLLWFFQKNLVLPKK